MVKLVSHASLIALTGLFIGILLPQTSLPVSTERVRKGDSLAQGPFIDQRVRKLYPQVRVLRTGAGSCSCTGGVLGYEYPDTYVGQSSISAYQPFQVWNIGCATFCQNQAIAVASALCDSLSLNNGVGYVNPAWLWSFSGTPSDSGTLNQQYDCDDI